jgi:hypothetical protein
MAELSERLVAAWQQAALDLGIDFVAPYHILTADHRRVSYLGLVRHFGGATGTLLRVIQLGELSVHEEIDRDFHVAKLGERHCRYEPLVFRGTLLEWGWTGPPELRPGWVPTPRAPDRGKEGGSALPGWKH